MKEIKSDLKKFDGQRLVAIVCIDEGADKRGKADKGRFVLRYLFDKNGNMSDYTTNAKEGENIESIYDVYPIAEIYEREIHDFFGVEFEGNPRLHQELFLDKWKGEPPLKKVK